MYLIRIISLKRDTNSPYDDDAYDSAISILV
jgi:hypothetical protein